MRHAIAIRINHVLRFSAGTASAAREGAMSEDELVMASGDWDIRSLEPEQKFARVGLSFDCIDAANRTQTLNPNFPGWQLYSRIVRGDTCFDRKLVSYAIRMAYCFARARKRNGREVVGERYRGPWIAQAGIDALERVIYGRFMESARTQGEGFGVDIEAYTSIRNVLVAFMSMGMDEFTNGLHYMLRRVEIENRRADLFE